MRAFIDYIATRAEQNKSRSMILAGDFNVAFEEKDLFHSRTNKGNAGFHDEERALFGELLDIGFVDALREVTQETGIYSWWSLLPGVKEKNVGWRLDYLLVQEPIRHRVMDCFHSADATGSDHCPVTLTLHA